MTFNQVKLELEKADNRLKYVVGEAWAKAKKELGGNWQDPDVVRRWRERAEQIADDMLKDVTVTVNWEQNAQAAGT